MKLNFKDPIYWLIILSVSFFLWGTCQKNKVLELKAESVNAQHQEQLKAIQNQVAVSAAKLATLQEARKNYTDSAKVQQRAQKEEIQASKVTIAKLRVNLQPKIDSFPELGQLIYRQDIVIKAQDSLIVALETAHSAEIVNLEGQLSARADMILAEVAQKDLWRLSAESAQKDVRKANRKKGFWRTTAAVLAGGIVWISLKE